jgi:membrane-bound lytic murein transglycosylase MltF
VAALLRSAVLIAVMMLGAADAARLRVPTTRYDDYFRKFSKRYFGPGFAWRVFKAQAMAESGLDSTAKSSVGAQGLMQLMPSTYDEIRSRRSDLKSVLDAQSNIAAGIAHDAYLWKFFGDIEPHPEHYRFMMAAYNAGEGTILRARRVAKQEQQDAGSWSGVATVAPKVPRWRYRETLGYVRQIAVYYERLKALDPVPQTEMDLEVR